ncbi:hypothetical protein ACHHYP_11520 [Achlya hypogyna]|uniref:Uncharacterized protein n=1 Tax=Achlya hypogyna TaxID=1202772 RepID=A0A1V9YJ07_ACHHY|nr:hypothetical protein ACHHYP_11520 [Achlya hypogyna]
MNPTRLNAVPGADFRVYFTSKSIPEGPILDAGNYVCEVTVLDRHNQPRTVIFNHVVASFNNCVPPSNIKRKTQYAEAAAAKRAHPKQTELNQEHTRPTPAPAIQPTRDEPSRQAPRGVADLLSPDEDQVARTIQSTQDGAKSLNQEQPSVSDPGHIVTAIEFHDTATFFRPSNLALHQENPYSLLTDEEHEDKDETMDDLTMTPLRVHCSDGTATQTRSKRSRHRTQDDDDLRVVEEAVKQNGATTRLIAATITTQPHLCKKIIIKNPESAAALGHARALQRCVATRAASTAEPEALYRLEHMLQAGNHPTGMVSTHFGSAVECDVRVTIADFDLVLKMPAPDLYKDDTAIGNFIKEAPTRLREDMLTD